MKKIEKKLCSIILVLTLIFGMIPGVSASTPTYETIQLSSSTDRTGNDDVNTGYYIWNPTSNTLVLSNYNDSLVTFELPDVDGELTIKLEGTSTISSIYSPPYKLDEILICNNDTSENPILNLSDISTGSANVEITDSATVNFTSYMSIGSTSNSANITIGSDATLNGTEYADLGVGSSGGADGTILVNGKLNLTSNGSAILTCQLKISSTGSAVINSTEDIGIQLVNYTGNAFVVEEGGSFQSNTGIEIRAGGADLNPNQMIVLPDSYLSPDLELIKLINSEGYSFAYTIAKKGATVTWNDHSEPGIQGAAKNISISASNKKTQTTTTLEVQNSSNENISSLVYSDLVKLQATVIVDPSLIQDITKEIGNVEFYLDGKLLPKSDNSKTLTFNSNGVCTIDYSIANSNELLKSGEHTFSAKFIPNENSDYSSSTSSDSKLTITQKPLEIILDSTSEDSKRVYDGTAIFNDIPFNLTGIVSNDDVAIKDHTDNKIDGKTCEIDVLDYYLEENTLELTGLDVDSNGYISLTGTDSSNYSLKSSDASGHVTITPANTLVATPTATDITYNGQEQSPKPVGISGFSTGNDITVEYSKTKDGTYSTTMPNFTDVGTYTVYYKASADNYETIDGDFSFKITPANSLVATPTATDITYNGQEQSPKPVEVSGYSTGNDITVEYSKTKDGTYSTTMPNFTDVGTYTVYYKASADNYKTIDGDFSFKITPANTLVATPTATDIVYNAQEQSPKPVEVSGFSTGNDITVEYSKTKDGTYSTTMPNFTDVGTYTVYYKASADNYETIDGDFSFKITPANSSIVVTDIEDTTVGNDIILNATVSGLNEDILTGTVTFYNDGTKLGDCVLNNNMATYIIKNSTFKSYSITAIFTSTDNNYNNSTTATAVEFKVEKNNQEISINNPGTITYNDKPFDLSITGQKGTGDVIYTVISGEGIIEINGSTATVVGTGLVRIQATIKADSTYDEASAYIDIDVQKDDVEIVFPTARGISYGQTLSSSVLSVTSNEFGTFAWVNNSEIPSVVNNGYEVVFTPYDEQAKLYNISKTTKLVSVDVALAEITNIVDEQTSVECNDKAQFITVPTADTVNKQKLVVTYWNEDTQAYDITTAPSFTDAGTYTVKYQLSAKNHISIENEFDFIITEKPAVDAPSTGDSMNFSFLFALLALSIICFVAIVFKKAR